MDRLSLALFAALDAITGPGAPHEETCDAAEHADGNSLCNRVATATVEP